MKIFGIVKAIVLILLGAFTAKKIFAQTDNLIKIVRTPFSEGAWARGSYGLTMSAGLSLLKIQKDLSDPTLEPDSEFVWQNFEIIKGVIWPVDVKAGLSYNKINRLLKFNSITQVAIFQKSLWPSLAINGGYSTLLYNQKATAENFGLSLSTSWGYQSILFFANLSQNISAVSIKPMNSAETSYSKTNQYGIQYRLNPLSKLSISRNLEQGSIISNEVKFSIGI